jgi:hypothetical protein
METETAARPEGKAAHGEEGATGPSLVERIKGTLGLGGGQKPGRERAEGEKGKSLQALSVRQGSCVELGCLMPA